MSAKWFISESVRKLVLLIFVIVCAGAYLCLNAQESDTLKTNRYDRRIHRYRKHWEALIPTHQDTVRRQHGTALLRHRVGLW